MANGFNTWNDSWIHGTHEMVSKWRQMMKQDVKGLKVRAPLEDSSDSMYSYSCIWHSGVYCHEYHKKK